jgi:hypothetical protein
MPSILVQPAGTQPARPACRRVDGAAYAWLTARPLLATLALALAGALLLQLWRPFFFLTCDTLSASLPVSTEAYRRLWEGRSPFYNPYLFGGFSLLGDLGNFNLWSPVALPFSFLARTRYYYFLPDIVGTLSLVVIAGAFCWSGLRLRRTLDLPIPVALVVGLSLSYAFTPYNFIVGASWIGFLSAQAAYPLILAAAFERDWRRALALESGALLYGLFGGHMHLFSVLLVFGGLTILLAAWVRRSVQPLLVWVAAGTLTLVLILPMLWPAIAGFSQTTRSAGLTAGEASHNNVAPLSLAASFLLGPMAQQMIEGIRIDFSDRTYNLAIAFALVNLPLAALLASKRRWSRLETGLLVLGLIAAVWIDRPYALAKLLSTLPVLKSLRWPFREIAVLQFFTHALFLVGYRPLTARAPRMIALAGGIAGAVIFALVFLSVAPTFRLFETDRRLIISGEADRYWNALRTSRGQNAGFPRFAVQADPHLVMPSLSEVPFALLGAFNYASLFRVPNIIGFSITPPPNAVRWEAELGVKHWFWGGIYAQSQIARIIAAQPDVQPIVLTGMKPATWRVFAAPASENFRLDTDSGRVLRQ